MAKAALNPAKIEQLIQAALSAALADPTSKPLHGTKAKPGFFTGTSAAAKEAAQACLDGGWIEPTGEFQGKGKTQKPLYRITTSGVRHAIENSETAVLLKDLLAALDQSRGALRALRDGIDDAGARIGRQIEQHQMAVGELLKKTQPPDLDDCLKAISSQPADDSSRPANGAPVPADWLERVVTYCHDFKKRHSYGNCPLPDLYHHVAEPLGLSIGQFHDGIRELVAKKRVRLHPFSGAAYQLKEEQYALLAGQEIKYYVEPNDR